MMAAGATPLKERDDVVIVADRFVIRGSGPIHAECDQSDRQTKQHTAPESERRRYRSRSPRAETVAQSCTLPFRRIVIGVVREITDASERPSAPPNAIRRYCRLKVCAGHRARPRAKLEPARAEPGWV